MFKNKYINKDNLLKIGHYALLVLTLFLAVFAFSIKSIPVSVAKIVAGFGWIVLVYYITKRNIVEFINFKQLKPFAIVFFLLVYSLINVIFITKTYDMHLAYAYTLFFVEHLMASLFFVWLMKKFNMFTLNHFFKIYVIMCIVQALIILISYFNTDLMDFNHVLMGVDTSKMNRYGDIRYLGLAHSTIGGLGVILGFALIFIVYFVNSAKSKKMIAGYSIAYITIMLASLLAGRMAYILIMISGIYWIYNFLASKKHRKTLGLFLLYLVIILLILALAVFMFYLYSDNAVLRSKILVDTNIFVFEPIYNNLNIPDEYLRWLDENHVEHEVNCTIIKSFLKNHRYGGEKPLVTNSVRMLSNSYFMPDLKTFLIGCGTYNWGYQLSDSGYMRHMLFYGVIFSMVLYGFYILVFRKMVRELKEEKLKAAVVILIAVTIFICNIKGDMFLKVDITKIVFIMYLILSVQKKGTAIDER